DQVALLLGAIIVRKILDDAHIEVAKGISFDTATHSLRMADPAPASHVAGKVLTSGRRPPPSSTAASV
ncbi:MAG: hypothetical protein V4462_04115, partial [Pseudomonadota bacterium]